MKKEYISPDFLFHPITFSEVLSGSVEQVTQYIDPNPGSWDDPIFEDDDGAKGGW